MADDQNTKPKTMDINDLVRELSKSSTAPMAPSPVPQAPRPIPPIPPSTSSGSSAKPPMPPSMVGLPTTPSSSSPKPFVPPSVPKSEMPRPQFSAPSQPFTKPSQPMAGQPLAGQAKPAPAPISATPPPTTPGVKEYQSSIRTMNEDISKIKQGQQPAGIAIPRKVEQSVPQTPQSTTPKPAMPSPQFKIPSVNLGEAQRTGPLAQSKDVSKPKPSAPTPPVPNLPKAVPAPQIYVPQEGQSGGNRNVLFIGIGVVAILAGFAYWFFVLRAPAPEIVIETPTPTPIATPTPFPPEKLGVTERISIPSTGVFLSALNAEMNLRQPIAGQIRLYDIVDENQQKYSFKDFLTKLSIDTAMLNDVNGLLDTKEWVLGSYGQLAAVQGSSVRSFIVLTQNDNALANLLMTAWEPKIINDLAGLFNLSNLSPELAFTPDVYSGINFRFVRIPDRDLGVAYVAFQNYLVLGSSRDSFRAVLDALITP